MKYCSKCGKEIMDEAVVCPNCGCSLEETKAQNSTDSSSAGWAFLGFCIPIVGLILYLVWKDSMPLRAKSAGKGALISVIILVIIYAIYAVILGILIGNGSW